MTKYNTARSAAAAAVATLATVAYASGDSGTGSVGEMQVTGSMLAMIVGGVAAMGVVIYFLVKLLNR
jgi:hypothetical protein